MRYMFFLACWGAGVCEHVGAHADAQIYISILVYCKSFYNRFDVFPSRRAFAVVLVMVVGENEKPGAWNLVAVVGLKLFF